MDGDFSPRLAARAAGMLYLIVILCGAFAEAYVRQRLVVPGDAAATAANILANEQLYRLGFVADLVPLLCNVVLAVLFYRLFGIVNRSVTALAIMFSLVGSAVQAAVLLFHLAPLLLLKGNPGLSAIPAGELQALAYLALRLQANGYAIALTFFGCFGVSLGYVVFKSGFIPRFVGVLLMIAGLGYFTNAMLGYVAPSLSSMMLLVPPCLLGEGAFTLWLLLVGVDAAKWHGRAKGNPS